MVLMMLSEINAGDQVVTRTGKIRMVDQVLRANTPQEIAAYDANLLDAPRGIVRYDFAVTRAIRNGKPFGASRNYRVAELTPAQD